MNFFCTLILEKIILTQLRKISEALSINHEQKNEIIVEVGIIDDLW